MARSSEQWLAALQGPGREHALADLRAALARGLEAALNRERCQLPAEDWPPLIPAAVQAGLERLDAYSGQGDLLAWCLAAAVRAALDECRLRGWRDVALQGRVTAVNLDEQTPAIRPLLQAMRQLDPRPREALIAAQMGVPYVVLEQRLGLRRAQAYGAVYAARRALKSALQEAGATPPAILLAVQNAALEDETLKNIARAVVETRPDEIDCDASLDLMAAFAELRLSGRPAAPALPRMQAHLERCQDCREEFEGLLAAIPAARKASQ